MRTTFDTNQRGGEGDMQRQKRLLQFVDKFLAATALLISVGPVIGQNVILATRNLQKRIDQGSVFGDASESATVSLCKDSILSIRRPQNCQRWTRPVAATQPRFEPIPTTPRKVELDRRNKFIASASSKTGLFDNVKHDALSNESSAVASFEERALMDWIENARNPTKFSALCVANKHTSVFSFLQAAMVAARHCAYVFLTIENV